MAQFDTHGNGNGLNDLYILPADELEATAIARFLTERGRSFTWSYANVRGHDWYGKRFIEVPFGESLAAEIAARAGRGSFGGPNMKRNVTVNRDGLTARRSRAVRCEICDAVTGSVWGPVRHSGYTYIGGRSLFHLCAGRTKRRGRKV